LASSVFGKFGLWQFGLWQFGLWQFGLWQFGLWQVRSIEKVLPAVS
jgi:hypothetical protein